MVNGEECWIYYESTLKISIVFRHYHAKTESFEQTGGKWKPGPHVQRSCARSGHGSDGRSRCGYMDRSRAMADSEKTRESPRCERTTSDGLQEVLD